MEFRHMKSPCGPSVDHMGCPFRKDTPPGEFSAERYEAMRATIGSDEDMLGVGDPMFACHKGAEGKEVACAGWLATFGRYHLVVRLAVFQKLLDMKFLYPQDGWPELHTDYEEVAAKGH